MVRITSTSRRLRHSGNNMATDIQQALDTLKVESPIRQRYSRYYAGEHLLSFATQKFESAFGRTLAGMRDNLCPIVVDAPADRMEVINFSSDTEAEKDAVADTAWAMWQRELMEIKSNEVHKEALKTGAGYLIAWPNEQNQIKFYVQDSRNCVVIEDEETGEPLYAAKMWETKEQLIRLTLYYADRIEKYITNRKKEQVTELKAEHFTTIADDPNVTNPYGVIPMFKFESDPVLSDAIPLQDALNKTFADRMVAQEFGAFRQRFATGLEPPENELTGPQKALFDGGIARLWFTNDKDVKFGDFEATALEPFLKAADSDRLEMARVSGTPLHFFSINTSDAISGKALKALEARFTKKVSRLTINFGATWSKVMKFALAIEGTAAENLTVQWAPVETQDEGDLLDAQIKKQSLGIPQETLWEELGYSEEDIAIFKAAAEQKAKDEAEKLNKQMAVNDTRKTLRLAS